MRLAGASPDGASHPDAANPNAQIMGSATQPMRGSDAIVGASVIRVQGIGAFGAIQATGLATAATTPPRGGERSNWSFRRYMISAIGKGWRGGGP